MLAQGEFGTGETLHEWLTHWVATELNINPQEISPDQPFLNYGMDSMHAMMLVGDLESRFGSQLSPTLAWDYPTIKALAQFLAENPGSKPSTTERSPRVQLSAVDQAQEPDARSILSQLDGMSEEEMDVLLQHYLHPSK
jgi:acyl carrier protein